MHDITFIIDRFCVLHWQADTQGTLPYHQSVCPSVSLLHFDVYICIAGDTHVPWITLVSHDTMICYILSSFRFEVLHSEMSEKK